MREFKKHFFEGLLQLTILATLLRHNTYDELNLITNSPLAFEQDDDNLRTYLDLKLAPSNTSDELRLLNRLSAQQLRPPSPPPLVLPPQQFIVAPVYRYLNNSTQKDIINLSETRLLLNSIEFNNNQLTKEVIHTHLRAHFHLHSSLFYKNLIRNDKKLKFYF